MMRTSYIGVDLAKKAGVAIYFAWSEEAHVSEIEGTPLVQLAYLQHIISLVSEPVISLELMHHFQNANTTRDILGRYGYIKWSLIQQGLHVREVSHQPARSYLGCKNKGEVLKYFQSGYQGASKLTDNHTDALAIAMYSAALDGHENGKPHIEVKNG